MTWAAFITDRAAAIGRHDPIGLMVGAESFNALRRRVFELQARIELVEAMEAIPSRVNGRCDLRANEYSIFQSDVAAATGISDEQLTQDYNKANYSSTGGRVS